MALLDEVKEQGVVSMIEDYYYQLIRTENYDRVMNELKQVNRSHVKYYLYTYPLRSIFYIIEQRNNTDALTNLLRSPNELHIHNTIKNQYHILTEGIRGVTIG